MKTQDINKIEITEGYQKGHFFTKWELFLKENGTRYYIDKVYMTNGKVDYLNIRNSKTGKRDIRPISSLKGDYYFTNIQ
jgi:hypothetical protein